MSAAMIINGMCHSAMCSLHWTRICVLSCLSAAGLLAYLRLLRVRKVQETRLFMAQHGTPLLTPKTPSPPPRKVYVGRFFAFFPRK